MRFRLPRFVLIAVMLAVAAASLLAGPATALAARASKVLDQIAALNKKALAAHKSGSDDEARTFLLDAVVLAKKNALSKHELCARTYLNLGAVHINGLNQREKGLRYLALAQRLRPGIQPSAALSTPKMRNALSEARRRQTELLAELEPADTGADHAPAREDEGAEPRTLASTSTGPAKAKEPREAKEPRDRGDSKARERAPARGGDGEDAGGAEGDLAGTADEPLHCPAPEVAPPKRELNLRCFAGPKVQAERVTLHYRREAGDDYTALRMDRGSKGWYTAAIPADAVTGKQLEFYVEAESADGVAGTSGYEELPNVINLRRGAPPAGRVSLSDVRMGSTSLLREGGQGDGEDASAEASGDADDPGASGGNRRRVGAFWVGLGLGSGYGAHLKMPLEHHPGREVSAGFAPGGLLQVMPEVGLQYDEHLSLSIQSRHQYIPSSGGPDMMVSGDPPHTAHALLAHILYQLWGGERFQFLGSATLGGGSGFRLKVAEDPGSQLASSDTVAGGPVVLGPGVALYYNINEQFNITGESRLLLGLGNFAAVLEGSLGVQYTFE